MMDDGANFPADELDALLARLSERQVQHDESTALRRYLGRLPMGRSEGGGATRRRTFLQLTSSFGGFLLADLERLGWAIAGSRSIDAGLTERLRAEASSHAREWETVPPPILSPAVRELLVNLQVLLSGSHHPWVARDLHVLAGEVAVLGGWLAFRRHDWGRARDLWALSSDVAHEFHHSPLLAHVLIGRSCLCSAIPQGGRGGDARRAVGLLDEAERAAGPQVPPLLRARTLARRAEEHALLGDEAAALRDLDGADRAVAAAGREDDGASALAVHWDAARVAGYRGNCLVLLSRGADSRLRQRCTQEASRILGSALAATSEVVSPQRSAVMTDLAAALIEQGEVEEACGLLGESWVLARGSGLADHTQRIVGVRARLAPWSEFSAVKRLDERLLD